MQFLTAKAQGIGLLVHAEKALVVAKDVATTKFRGLGGIGVGYLGRSVSICLGPILCLGRILF